MKTQVRRLSRPTFFRGCPSATSLIGTDLLMAWAYLVETAGPGGGDDLVTLHGELKELFAELKHVATNSTAGGSLSPRE